MNHQALIKACQDEWDNYIEHPFVQQLALGELPSVAFLHYLKQDFLFLKHYTRAYALAIYKANTLSEMRMALPSVKALLDPMRRGYPCMPGRNINPVLQQVVRS